MQVFSGLKGTQLWQTDLTGHWKQVCSPAISAHTDGSGHKITIAGSLDRYSVQLHMFCISAGLVSAVVVMSKVDNLQSDA